MGIYRRDTVIRYAVAALLGAAAVLCASLITSDYILERERALAKIEQREGAQLVRLQLERDLRRLAQVSVGVSTAISHDPDIDQSAFTNIASRVLEVGRNTGNEFEILNIAASSDLVVRFVYPYARNSGVVGLNYRDVPGQREIVERVKNSGTIELTDPIDLVQGGQGIVARMPVSEFDSGKVWGVVSVVGSLDTLLSNANKVAAELGLKYAVYREDSSWPLFGNPSVSAQQPLSLPLSLPSGSTWNLSIVPVGGWPTAPSNSAIIWIGFITIGVLAFLFLTIYDWAAEARRQAAKQLRLAIDGIADGFAIYDADDRLVICNEAYKNFYPRSSKRMTQGTLFKEIIKFGVEQGEYLDAVGCEEEWLEQRMAAHARADHSIVQRLADGRWLKVYEHRLKDGSTVGFRVDITQLMEARQAAEAASRAKSLFLDRMSHELRTPLAILLGYLSFIEQPSKFPSYKKIQDSCDLKDLSQFEAQLSAHAIRIRKSGNHLLGMVDRILDISKSERRSAINEPELISLDAVLSSALGSVDWAPGSKPNICAPAGEPIHVRVDTEALENALTAVFRHCEAAFNTSKIDVAVKKYTASVEIQINAYGKRVPTVLEAKVFHQAFEALDASRGCEMSLDLAIAERLLAQSNGAFFFNRKSDTHDQIEISLQRALFQTTRKNAA